MMTLVPVLSDFAHLGRIGILGHHNDTNVAALTIGSRRFGRYA